MKSKYLIPLLLLVIGLSSTKSIAQGIFMQDVTGQPIKSGVYADVTGSPYLVKDWQKGTIKLKSGSVYKDVDLKLDLMDNKFVFKGATGEAMAFADPLESVTMSDNTVFKNGYTTSGVKPTDFLEVLADGNASLLKKINKSVKESREYNSATVDKAFVNAEVYYIKQKDGNVQLISKDKKDVLKALNDKSAEVEKYIGDNKLNVKKDPDLVKVITYYNTL